jgi:hypothetical protein
MKLDRMAALIAGLLGREAGESFAFARRVAEAGELEKQPGGGDDQRAAILLLLAMATHHGAKHGAALAPRLYDLQFIGGERTFFCASGNASIPLENLAAICGTRFGDMLEALVTAYRIGLTPAVPLDDQHNQLISVTGVRIAVTSAVWWGACERETTVPNEDGHLIRDAFSWLDSADVMLGPQPVDAIRSTFIPVEVMRRIADELGPFDVADGGGSRATIVSGSSEDEDLELGIAASAGQIPEVGHA